MTGLVGTVRIFNHHINVGYSALAVIDLLLFIGSVYLGSLLYFHYVIGSVESNTVSLAAQAIVFAVVTSLAMLSMGLYEPKLREGANGVLLRTAGAFGLSLLALSFIFYLVPDIKLWRGSFAMSAVMAFTASLANRQLWTRFIDMEQFKRRVLVLGSGDIARVVNNRMRRRADRRGFRVVGFARHGDGESCVEGEPIVTLDRPLSDFVLRYNIDDVVIALDERRDNLPREEIERCRLMGVRVSGVVDFFEREAGKVLIEHVQPDWFTFTSGFQRGDAHRFSKRLFDVTMSFLLLMVAWPLMLLAVLAIWLEDGIGAPVLYRQRRVGLNGRVYDVIKFRSMTVNAESDGKARWATANDCRVTRVGRFIRKTRIDELPQIINVMAGDMAFVGPRPERPEFVRELSEAIPFYEKRHCVKPGITGWAQMNYPYGASLEDTCNKLEFDLYYVKNQSLFLDFLVLLQTAEVVLFGKGAR